jgi:Protein of unknown function (DUF615)
VTFNEVLSQTIALLHQHGRVSYRALKRQFALDDDYLADLQEAILFAHPQVRDEEGRGLVWTGDAGPAAAAIPTADAPLTPSKSQRKRDAQALQTLGGQLVALSATQLARLDLPETLHEAVLTAQRMRAHGARSRQMHYIGKLMRQLEPTVISRVRAALTPGRADGQGLEPDHGGGHVASFSPQRNRELPHGQTRAGATQRSHQAGRGPTAAREMAAGPRHGSDAR